MKNKEVAKYMAWTGLRHIIFSLNTEKRIEDRTTEMMIDLLSELEPRVEENLDD